MRKRQTSPHSAALRRSSHRQTARRTETCRGSNSVLNLVLEDLDEPLNPENHLVCMALVKTNNEKL